VCQYEWLGVQGELDKYRASYMKDHQDLMTGGFGKGYDFEMKRFKLNKGQYLTMKLEMLEQGLIEKEERFNELHRYLGRQYCHGLEPSVVGFKKCIARLLLD